jgi:hypothetical protein
MSTDADAVRYCLRAFADAQVTQFYPLWNRINQKVGRIIAPVQFRIYRSDSGRDAAYIVLGVEFSRTDGTQIGWSVRLNASADQMEVSAGVELTDDDGNRELFGRKAIAASAPQAAEFIMAFSAEICSHDECIPLSAASGAA